MSDNAQRHRLHSSDMVKANQQCSPTPEFSGRIHNIEITQAIDENQASLRSGGMFCAKTPTKVVDKSGEEV